VGCRRVRAKRELVRIARAQSGLLVTGRGGAGQGAYVCPDARCLERARSRLGGALRTSNVDFKQLADHVMSGEQQVV
jgi:predicted RNA-binding protein YlxR (DUF448 family)